MYYGMTVYMLKYKKMLCQVRTVTMDSFIHFNEFYIGKCVSKNSLYKLFSYFVAYIDGFIMESKVHVNYSLYICCNVYYHPLLLIPPTFNYNNYFNKSANFNSVYFDDKPSNISGANNTRYMVLQ